MIRTYCITPLATKIRCNSRFRIVESCLYDNTLVTLPTGLGKTFIAAVVMYNYFRWFPLSKIVFMAPTKPLVQQQIEACFNIMGIPQIEVSDIIHIREKVCDSTSPICRRW